MKLRGYQEQSVTGVRNAYKHGYKAPLLVLPTGGGKTIVFSYIAYSSSQQGKKVLILVHRIELLKQTAAKLRAFGIRVGLISPKFSPDHSAGVQVAMVQTMIKRLPQYPNFDLIITDEAHHAISSTYVKVIDYYKGVYQLGVTATPIRTDGRGLGVAAGGVFDTLVIGPTTAELIEMGYLVEPVVYASEQAIDLTGVKKTSRGDYSNKQLSQKMNKPKLIGNVVHHYNDIARGEPGVAFCTSVQHAEDTAAEFRRAGFKFYALHGKTDSGLRERLIRGLGDGSIHGLTSCDVISEGTDIPAIAVAMMLRPTESLGLYLQQGGRALRPSEGKDKAIILDHAGNTYKHGFLDEDRTWSLGGSKKKKKKGDCPSFPPIVQCEKCYSVYKSIKPACPQCGEVRIIKSKELEVMEGQLSEITAIDKERIKRQRLQMIGTAKTLDDLKNVAKSLGYKPGWANHIYKAREKKAADKAARKNAIIEGNEAINKLNL